MSNLLHERRALMCLKKTPVILRAVLKDAQPHSIRTLTDGPEGWNVIYVLCHLRDYERIFLGRFRAIVEQDRPVIVSVGPETLIEQNNYAAATFPEVFDELIAARRETIAFLETLSESQWLREGAHPTVVDYSIVNLANMIALHDVDHLEQITRILGLAEAL